MTPFAISNKIISLQVLVSSAFVTHVVVATGTDDMITRPCFFGNGNLTMTAGFAVLGETMMGIILRCGVRFTSGRGICRMTILLVSLYVLLLALIVTTGLIWMRIAMNDTKDVTTSRTGCNGRDGRLGGRFLTSCTGNQGFVLRQPEESLEFDPVLL